VYVRGFVLDPSGVSERLGDLTSRERELVDAAASGDVLECSQLPIEQLSATDDPEHTIRAELLRELLLKRCNKPPDPRGVRLRGARITGTLDLTHVEAAVGMQLWGCCFDQPVLLRGAHLPWLSLTDSCVPALAADRLQVDGGLFLDGGFRAIGVRLLGGRITGQLVLSGAVLINEAGPALVGDGLQVDGGLFLDGGFWAVGHGEDGAMRLSGARISGTLSLNGAKLINEAGPALHGDGLRVDGSLFLGEGFWAVGHGEGGAVRLLGAHISGPLSLRDAKLTNNAGPALVGDGLRVDGNLLLDGGFWATGHAEGGAVRLLGARITGSLDLSGAVLINEDGLVLDLENAEAKTIALPPGVVCPQGVAGRSTCCDAATRRVDLSGFVYTSLVNSHSSQWLHLIARHTAGYRPQPYQQLAALLRAAGHDADAREILIAQQQDLRERGYLGGRLPKTVHFAWEVLAGYGYRTRRTAAALLIVLLAAGALGIFAGCVPTSPGRYVAMHTPQADASGSPCSLLEQIGVGIDRGLPLATTGIRSRCDFDTTNHWGQVITAFTWILQLFVWVLATGVVAGYVGLIRKAT
jgi:hypothetical protein